MNTIKITGSNNQIFHHKYYSPYSCKANGIFPKMFNGGWNDFHFCTPVSFTFENMPLIEKTYGEDNTPVKSDNYIWYSCPIEVEDNSGRKISGEYYITFDKKAGKYISENVNFS